MVVLDQALLQYLDQLVDQLASAGAHAAANPEALRELVELSGGADFTPGVAVHLLVTRNLLFVPTLCSEMKRSASEAQRRREGSRKLLAGGVELVWSVCLLKRLVERLVDKERELYKVASILTSSDMFPCFTALIDGPDEEAVLPGQPGEGELRSWLMTIVRWCYNYDKTCQVGKVESLYEAHSTLFNIGFYAKVVQIFGAGPMTEVTQVAATLLQGVADCPKTKFREKLRKSGVIMLASSRLAGNPNFRMCSILLYNMSRSVSTHNSMRDAELLAAAEKLVAINKGVGPTSDPVVQLSLTLAVANVYGTDASNAGEAEAFLSQQNVAAQVVDMMNNALSGLDAIPHVQDWDVSGEEVAFMACCLSQHGTFNKQLVDAGLLDALDQMMNEVADWTLPCVRTLLNLAYSPGIAQTIRSAKMTGKLVPLTSSPDMRVSDAAKACLTELGYDMKRNIFDSRSMQERMSQNEQASIGFNVFLSHRRADSKDFARALFNLLTQRGYSTYLDFEYLKELNDLQDAVARSQNFVFILSDHIFDSFWCKEELLAAVRSGCNIILIVKEGSKWINSDGQDVYEFPPSSLITALPDEIQKVFANNVAIKHSDEYYQSFVEKLMDRLVQPTEEQQGQGAASGGMDTTRAGTNTTKQWPVPGGRRRDSTSGAPVRPASHISAAGAVGSAQLMETTHQVFMEATDRLQASFVDMYSKMQTQLMASNVSELQQVRQGLSSDLAVMQRQVTAEMSHMRQQVTLEILEVRREVATEMGMMKATLHEVCSALQDLAPAGARRMEGQHRHTHARAEDYGRHDQLATFQASSEPESSSRAPPGSNHASSKEASSPSLGVAHRFVYPDLKPARYGSAERGASSRTQSKANHARRTGEGTALPELPNPAGRGKGPERGMLQYTLNPEPRQGH